MATVKQFNVDGTLVDIRDSRTLVTGVKGNNESAYRTGNVNITKANIGLSDVPNVTTNNQTPTFTQASTRANIASGETLTVIFSKIMKFFADLKAVAFSGSYNDLSDKPTIPTVNNATLTIQKNGTTVNTFTANASSNVTANITMSKSDVGLDNVGNFKAVSTVASQGLTNTEKANARANIGAGTSSFSGSYTDLTNKPTIPTVNNATLTIQKNGTNVQTFTANASSNKTANITVPTKTSELTNDSGFITNAGVTGVKGNSETTYRTGNVNITKANIGLGSVGNFKAVSTAASQGLTDTEKANARANIGAGTSSFSGSYTDLTNKPTIPTVNNATLTIQKNGTNVQTFTANASANKTANITVPTKVSELTNDSAFMPDSDLNVSAQTSVATLSNNQTYTIPATGYYLLGVASTAAMSGNKTGTFKVNDRSFYAYNYGAMPTFINHYCSFILKKGQVLKFITDGSMQGQVYKLF